MVGAAAGIGDRPVWLFRAEVDPAELVEYYLDPSTRPGWEIRSHSPGLAVLLEREADRLLVTASRAWRGTHLSYQASRHPRSGP